VDQLEAYIKGEPLNDAMAALKRGEEPESDPAPGQMEKPDDLRELNDDEREHLRRLQLEPGWAILFRLMDDKIRVQEARTIDISANDPLGNRDQIAQGWAYLAMMKKVRQDLKMTIGNEIYKLEWNRQRAEDAR
jgi:hypothetical protein